MLDRDDLCKEADHRIAEIDRAPLSKVIESTMHHLQVAPIDIQRAISELVLCADKPFGYSVPHFVHKAIPLRRIPARVLPAIAGLKRLGRLDKANALEDLWNGWLKSYEEITSHCPRKMPEGASARNMLVNTMRVEISHLLHQIVAGLKCEAEAI